MFQTPPTGKSARHAHGPGAPPPVLCRQSEPFRVRARRMRAYLVLLLHVVVSNSGRPLGNRVERLVFSFSFSFSPSWTAAGTRRVAVRTMRQEPLQQLESRCLSCACAVQSLGCSSTNAAPLFFRRPAENARDSRCSCSHRTFGSSQSLLTS